MSLFYITLFLGAVSIGGLVGDFVLSRGNWFDRLTKNLPIMWEK